MLAQKFRERAEECRAIADQTTELSIREQYRSIAEAYEMLARQEDARVALVQSPQMRSAH